MQGCFQRSLLQPLCRSTAENSHQLDSGQDVLVLCDTLCSWWMQWQGRCGVCMSVTQTSRLH